MTDLNKIVDELSKLSVMEAAELSKLLQEKWGVSAAAPVAVAAAGGEAASAAQADGCFSKTGQSNAVTWMVGICCLSAWRGTRYG